VSDDSEARERGRDRFRRYRPVLVGAARALGLAPPGVLAGMWAASSLLPGSTGLAVRYSIALRLAASCGDNVYIGDNVEIRGWENLRLGSNVSIHRGCYLDATGGITIGDDVSIAHHTSVMSTEHTWEDASIPIKDNPLRAAAVVIEDDVWVGCGCRVLAGVTLHRRSIVGSGAVVTRDVASGAVVGGVPARVIKRLD
jgi:acetyltransferase-like isoleucine patch superfamily enzyme